MLKKIKMPPEGSPDWWPYIGLFDSGIARPLVGDDLDEGTGIAPKRVPDEGQYRRLAVSCRVDLTNEMPDGAYVNVSNWSQFTNATNEDPASYVGEAQIRLRPLS